MNDLFSQYPETAILSFMMQNIDQVDTIIGDIKPFMLSSSPNRSLFESISELHKNGIKPEYGFLVTKLQEKGKLSECGGEPYLKFLLSQQINPDNVSEHLNYVINSFKSRQVLSLGSSIPSLVSDISNIDTVIGNIRTSLDSLSISMDSSVGNMEVATKEAWEELIKRINNPEKIDISTGLTKLDAVTGGYWPEDVWVIAGRPGMGKTSFLCNSVLSGVPSLVFSLEMNRQSLIYRLASILSGVPIFNMRLGKVNQDELNQIGESIKILKDMPIFIDTSYITNIESVVSLIRKYKRTHGIKVVHIDYVQLLAERSPDATNELGRIIRSLKLLARDIEVPQILYSQLHRGVESREDKRPVLSDLRQSGNLEEDADVALFLYRDIVYNKETKFKNTLELLLRKQRNGPTGMVSSIFNDQTNKIMDEE